MDDRHVAFRNVTVLRVLTPLFLLVIGIHNFVNVADKNHGDINNTSSVDSGKSEVQQRLDRELELSTIDMCYFVSPKYPDMIDNAGEYLMNIRKKSKDVNQIRLEFIHFNLALPNSSTEICETDVFTVTGGEYDELKICGPFDDQHMVYELNHLTEEITFRVKLSMAGFKRRWMIRIIQVESARRMDTGCFQYYYKVEGTIPAIDFAMNGRELLTRPNDRICIRHIRRKCFIEYESCDWDSITHKLKMFSSIVFPGSPISKKIPFGTGDWEKVPKNFNSSCIKYKQRKC